MKKKSNRNLLFAGIAAVVVAATTAAVLLVANCGGDDESTGGATAATARRIMTPVPVDQGKASAARDSLVASIASKGSGQVIVQVATNLSPNASAQDEVRAIAAAQDNVVANASGAVNVVARSVTLPLMLVTVDEAGARSLANSSGVVSMMENTPEDASVDDTIPAIGAPNVYAAGYSGQGWSVAVLDTPQDVSHHFFADRVVAEACFSTNFEAEDFTAFSICPGLEPALSGPGSASNCQADWCNHGTHVVGIAAGNGSGGSGVAKDAGIVAVNIFSDFADCRFEDNCIRTFPWDQISALEWVLENKDVYKIAAVNMSIGGAAYEDQATCDAEQQPRKEVFDRLVAANIAVLVASGNAGRTNAVEVPSCISSAISVGSVTKSGTISDFSNSSSLVDFLAHGSDIVSAAPGGGWVTLSGTSMATPHTAGAFTVLRSAAPNATVAEIFSAMVEGGVDFRDPRNGIVRSRLQLDGALNVLLGGDARQPTPTPRIQPRPAPSGAPVNDDQDNPTAINSANYRDTIDVRQATVGDDAPIKPTYYCQEGGRFEKTVWYSFTAPSNGYLTITTQGSNYDTIVSVWQGSRGAPFQIGCNDDDAYPNNLTTTIAGWVAQGTTFRIQVGAWDNGGTLVFSSYFQASNASATYTDPNVAPVVFDAALSEVPSDLASGEPTSGLPVPAKCDAKGVRTAELKGECFKGLAPR